MSSWRTTIRPPAAATPVVEALLDGRDDLVEGQPAVDVLLGGVADLGVDDAVGGQVLDALAGHPGERRGRSASPRRCGRRSPGSAPASRSRPPRRTSGPARRRPSAGSSWPQLGGQVDDRSAGAGRRRGGRAAGPWGRGGPGRGSGVVTAHIHPRRILCSAHAHLHHPRRGRRRGRQGARHQRVARRSTRTASTASPTRPATTSGSTSTPSARRPARSAAPSPTATSRSSCSPTSHRRCSRWRRPGAKLNYGAQQGALPAPGAGRQRLRSHVALRRGHRPAGGQAADRSSTRSRSRATTSPPASPSTWCCCSPEPRPGRRSADPVDAPAAVGVYDAPSPMS